MTEDDGPALSADSLERAATWRELYNLSKKAADRLAEIAARFVAEKDRLPWIENQLEEWEAEMLGNDPRGRHPAVVGAQRVTDDQLQIGVILADQRRDGALQGGAGVVVRDYDRDSHGAAGAGA